MFYTNLTFSEEPSYSLICSTISTGSVAGSEVLIRLCMLILVVGCTHMLENIFVLTQKGEVGRNICDGDIRAGFLT